jgi:hypothetical protein
MNIEDTTASETGPDTHCFVYIDWRTSTAIFTPYSSTTWATNSAFKNLNGLKVF